MSIKASSFIHCSTPSYYCGGGLHIVSVSVIPEIIATDIMSCSAGEDGGGIYTEQAAWESSGPNIPVRECRFINCHANGIASWISSNEADGGALFFWDTTRTFGVSEILLLSNRAEKDGGALFFPIYADVTQHSVAFCFFHNNYAPFGCDALIHFHFSSTNKYEKVFLQSFTTYTEHSIAESNDSPWNIQNPINWLPQALV